MMDFQLFRVKVYPALQGELFAPDISRPLILRQTVESLPSGEFREGLTWHIGNIMRLDDSSLYFRIGRTSKETLEMFNEKEGTFQDQEFPTAPYTHGLLDFDLELCAIAKKPRLAKTTFGIARQFARLLDESAKAKEFKATIEIDEIKDPDDFIIQLQKAHSISKFTFYFKRPNPWDADKDFVKPQQEMLRASNGVKGKVEISGIALSSHPLEAMARSAASTGDDASATIKMAKRSKKATRHLKGNPATVSAESLATQTERLTFMEILRSVYNRIRGNGNEQ